MTLSLQPLSRTSFARPVTFALRALLALIIWVGPGALIHAQVVNSWINPGSGAWEDGANWSLGSRPASGQSVAITNGGYKGVGISSATVSGFPGSMTVNNLSISAPGSALSALILNYFGTEIPLRVQNYGEIGANGSLQNFYSSLQVDGSTAGSYDGSPRCTQTVTASSDSRTIRRSSRAFSTHALAPSAWQGAPWSALRRQRRVAFRQPAAPFRRSPSVDNESRELEYGCRRPRLGLWC